MLSNKLADLVRYNGRSPIVKGCRHIALDAKVVSVVFPLNLSNDISPQSRFSCGDVFEQKLEVGLGDGNGNAGLVIV